MKSTDLRPGMAIRMDGQLFAITQFKHVTPGNLRAFVQVKLRNVATGHHIEKRLRAGEEIERVDLDRRDMEYLYSDSTGHVFMDSEHFDQIALHDDLLGDAMLYLTPNTSITVLMSEGRPVAVEFPESVELVVSQTAPVASGATATNQLKEAVLETGLKVRVPQFIVEGERVRIRSHDDSYLGRA